MRRGGVVDADRDAGVEYAAAAAVDEEAHPRTEATHGGTLRREGTRGTAAARTTSRARARTAAGAQGTGKTQAAGT
jgi:hypothetical protein